MTTLDRRALIASATVAGLAALVGRAKAGPINPPSGPVTGTNAAALGLTAIPGGTTQFSITQPGSYILTGNLTVAGVAIGVSAGDVTLDLNGYTVTCTDPNSYAIYLGSFRNITVRNGHLRGGDSGLGCSVLTDSIIEDLLVTNTRFSGIYLNSAGVRSCIVRRCLVSGVGAAGLATDNSSFLAGIICGGGACRIEDCTVSRLVFNGVGSPTFRGIHMSAPTGLGGAGNIVARCTVTHDAAINGIGINFNGTGVYRDNTVMNFSTPYSGGSNGNGNV
jgi:hypothetical protein